MVLCISVFLSCVTHSYDEATSTMDSGYPRSIEDDFPGMDDEFDAAAYHYGIKELSAKYIRNTRCFSLALKQIFYSFLFFRILVFLPRTRAV